jgi:cholest-4-en-3-one 26-monooxygenase
VSKLTVVLCSTLPLLDRRGCGWPAPEDSHLSTPATDTYVDLLNLDLYAERAPLEQLGRLRREDPVHWHPTGADETGYWSITKHADVAFVSKNPGLFTSTEGTNVFDPDPEMMVILRDIMINMDPPRHNEYRGVVNKRFLPRSVNRYAEFACSTAREVVAAAVAKGRCDFVEDVAAILPMTLICELFGIPESERRYVYELANRLISADDPEVLGEETSDEVFAEVFVYATGLAAQKRENLGDDLASVLLSATVEGKPLDDMMFGTFVVMMIVAGNETTRTVTTNGMARLLDHPEQLQALRDDPSLLPNAIEEMLRFEPAVHHFRRTATEDVEIRGRKISKGEKVVLWYGAANRDEEVFEDPERFDIRRANARDHVAFGIGQHFCLGAHLARLQLRTLFEELLASTTEIRQVAPLRRLRSNFVNGVKEMQVELVGRG